MAGNKYGARKLTAPDGQVFDSVKEFHRCIALHDPKVMGKDTFGEKRLERLFEALQKLANEYSVAFSQDKEADYYQDLMDRQLRDIYGDRAEPFYVRYPDLKKIKYDKARKGWK